MDSSFLDDETANSIGAGLALMLNLERDTEHPNRFKTEVGTKTCQGLARTVFAVFLEAYQSQSTSLLVEYSEKLHSLENGGGMLPAWARAHAISDLKKEIARLEEEVDKQNAKRA